MVIRSLALLLACITVCVCVVGCSDDSSSTGDADQGTPSGTVSGAGRTDATMPTGTGSTSTVRAGAPPIETRVGAPVSFEAIIGPDALGRNGDLPSAFPVGARLVVWVRTVDDASPESTETSAEFGVAEVREVDRSRARLEVRGEVPPTLWRREQRRRVATPVSTPAGPLEVAIPGFFAQRLVTRAVAPPTTTSALDPDRGALADRVLGATHLAGVRFDVAEDDALAAFVARFGAPSSDDRASTECGAERTVTWGSLLVSFRAAGNDAAAPRSFAAYSYSAPHAGIADGPQGLRTERGVAPGATLPALLALEPATVFASEQVGYTLTTWFAANGSRLAGRLSDDVSAREVTVTEIASSAESQSVTTYPGCAVLAMR